MMWFDISTSAREHYPIEMVQQLLKIIVVSSGGNDEGVQFENSASMSAYLFAATLPGIPLPGI